MLQLLEPLLRVRSVHQQRRLPRRPDARTNTVATYTPTMDTRTHSRTHYRRWAADDAVRGARGGVHVEVLLLHEAW